MERRRVARSLRGDSKASNSSKCFASPSTPALEQYFREQGITLQEGQQAEVCLEACRWIENAGRALGRGFVMTIDYGHEARALYDERHNRGTLLAYRDHTVTENILDAPGEQDLTAHVNFTALDLWGRRAGLERTGLVTQSQFLVALGRANEFGDLYEPGQTEVEKLRARLLLKNLIHPEGLGEKFQVLIQHKGIETRGSRACRVLTQTGFSLSVYRVVDRDEIKSKQAEACSTRTRSVSV